MAKFLPQLQILNTQHKEQNKQEQDEGPSVDCVSRTENTLTPELLSLIGDELL